VAKVIKEAPAWRAEAPLGGAVERFRIGLVASRCGSGRQEVRQIFARILVANYGKFASTFAAWWDRGISERQEHQRTLGVLASKSFILLVGDPDLTWGRSLGRVEWGISGDPTAYSPF
jgi:hypothetical protein